MGQVTAAMPDDIATEVLTPSSSDDGEEQRRWHLIERLESTAIGKRAHDGAISVRRGEPAGCILFGPYMHLPEGRYRLSFRCRNGTPRMAAQPVLGADIIILSRFQLEWRDFTAAELTSGMGSFDFAVPREHSLEGENEGRFEFRFFHLGNADLAITAVDVERLPPGEAPLAAPRVYRLLGRLNKGWRGRRDQEGSISVPRLAPAGPVLRGGWPYLRLPRGHYRLTVAGSTGRTRRPERPVIGVEVLGQSRWRIRATSGVVMAARDVSAVELAGGGVALDFAVPIEMAIEAGADAPFEFRIRYLGNAAVTIHAVDLMKLDGEPTPAAPHLRPSGRRRIVMIGNCQTETLRQGFTHSEALSRLFDVKYHFVQLPKNLHEFAARDLEACDILLIQDIRLWNDFPLRDAVRPGAEVHRFPLVRFASLWPFDGWNGPSDRLALEREAPNLTFPYLDGLLARLRCEIPDPEARFAAYRDLAMPGLVNYQRLHQLEERRLAALDQQFGISIGAYTLENFRRRRIFHTTVRPNWQVFSLLIQFVAGLVGAREKLALSEKIDPSLRNPQVPVHPKVARDLGVKWADERTRYVKEGREISWETYVRSYIEHYG
jgi:hypothetical protein